MLEADEAAYIQEVQAWAIGRMRCTLGSRGGSPAPGRVGTTSAQYLDRIGKFLPIQVLYSALAAHGAHPTARWSGWAASWLAGGEPGSTSAFRTGNTLAIPPSAGRWTGSVFRADHHEGGQDGQLQPVDHSCRCGRCRQPCGGRA